MDVYGINRQRTQGLDHEICLDRNEGISTDFIFDILAVTSLLIGPWAIVTLLSSCLKQKLTGVALGIFLSFNKRVIVWKV